VAVGGSILALGIAKLVYDFVGHSSPRGPRQPWEGDPPPWQ